jgi:hypothetical protein
MRLRLRLRLMLMLMLMLMKPFTPLLWVTIFMLLFYIFMVHTDSSAQSLNL